MQQAAGHVLLLRRLGSAQHQQLVAEAFAASAEACLARQLSGATAAIAARQPGGDGSSRAFSAHARASSSRGFRRVNPGGAAGSGGGAAGSLAAAGANGLSTQCCYTRPCVCSQPFLHSLPAHPLPTWQARWPAAAAALGPAQLRCLARCRAAPSHSSAGKSGTGASAWAAWRSSSTPGDCLEGGLPWRVERGWACRQRQWTLSACSVAALRHGTPHSQRWHETGSRHAHTSDESCQAV